jgi:arabinofuranosyltransferase
MRTRILTYLLLGAIIALSVWQAFGFEFLQDDAFISYRYVANYLQGDGLVYNQGERVEGYTNFGWVLGLILSGLAGLDYIFVSRITGIIFAAGTVLMTFLLAERLMERRSPWWPLLPAALAGINLSSAYWAQSGLETAAFAFVALLAIYLFVVRSHLLAAALVAAVLVRPEGALLAALIVCAEALIDRRLTTFSLVSVGLALVYSLPFAAFKLVYYGSLLPNPFYAKTAFGWAQVASGWEYAVGFAGHYPFLAAGLVFLPIVWWRLGRSIRLVWVIALGYTLYIVLVGGDVLMVHRFFVPMIPLLATVAVLLLFHLVEHRRSILQYSLLAAAAAAMIAGNLLLPRDYIRTYASREAGLVAKMGFFAARLKEIGSPNFTVAASTIGRLGYDLNGHRMIDMLGLTDSTIARHPEPIPAGLESSWRERSFNSAYLLGEQPEFIVFSTGLKPSAPAERVLLTYEQFLDCYRGASWLPNASHVTSDSRLVSVFRRVRPLQPPFEPTRPIEFVNAYTDGTNALLEGRLSVAESELLNALRLGGEPPYVYLLYRLAMLSFELRQGSRGEAIQNRALELDSVMPEIQADLYVYEYTIGNRDKAAVHRRWVQTLSPWLLPSYDSVAQARSRQYQSQKSITP